MMFDDGFIRKAKEFLEAVKKRKPRERVEEVARKPIEQLREEIERLRGQLVERAPAPKEALEAYSPDTPYTFTVLDKERKAIVDVEGRGRLFFLQFRTSTTGFSVRIKKDARPVKTLTWGDLEWISDGSPFIDLEETTTAGEYMVAFSGADKWSWNTRFSLTIVNETGSTVILKQVYMFYLST